jgi:hypothetical protein
LTTPTTPPAGSAHLVRGHLRFGWWSLFAFLIFGFLLELFHGIKAGFYLDGSQETRRLLWTLAHAHGAVLSLVHLGFAATVAALPAWPPRPRSLASRGLTAATVLIPGGFFLGGLFVHAGDPGLGVLLVPVGAALLALAVALAARAASPTTPIGTDHPVRLGLSEAPSLRPTSPPAPLPRGEG